MTRTSSAEFSRFTQGRKRRLPSGPMFAGTASYSVRPSPVFIASRVQGGAAVAAVALATAAAACGLTGPGDPERSIVGTYRGSWIFGIHDPHTIATGDDPPGGQGRGWIYCPGELQVTEQDGKDIRGRFELQGPGRSCHPSDGGVCSDAVIAKFCRPISGTLKGEAFSTGSPSATTILFEFRMTIAQSEGRAALGRFIGCTVIAEENEVFKGGVREDVSASAFVDATADCDGQAGLNRVDVSVRLEAARAF
jgi:hypothetical protein